MSGKQRIGTLLVDQGLITAAQLERALRTQLILGGHLGTSLVELGYVEEDALAAALGRALGLRHATRRMLAAVPADVIALLSPQTAERCRAVPLGKGFRSLHVAVIAPRDSAAISAQTGQRVIPWIAPEIGVLEALERYYGVPRPRRFVALSAKPRAIFTLPEIAPIVPPSWATLHARPATAAAGRSGTTPRSGSTTKPAAATKGVAGGTAVAAAPAAATAAAAVAEPVEATAAVVAGGMPAVRRDAPRHPPEAPSAGLSQRWSLGEVARLLSHADDREELAGIVLDYATQHMARTILFGVRGEQAYPWDWRGFDISSDRVLRIEFPVASGSIFQLLAGEPFFQGPVPDRPQYRAFYETLSHERPSEVLLMPIHLADRLIAVIYGEGTVERPIAADVDDLLHLADKISMALHVIVLKFKIRAG